MSHIQLAIDILWARY